MKKKQEQIYLMSRFILWHTQFNCSYMQSRSFLFGIFVIHSGLFKVHYRCVEKCSRKLSLRVCGNNILSCKEKEKEKNRSTRLITDGISIEYYWCQWMSISCKQAMTSSTLHLNTHTCEHTECSSIRLNVVISASAAIIPHTSNEDQLFAFNCALIQTHAHFVCVLLSAVHSKWLSLSFYDKSKQGCSFCRSTSAMI